MFRRHQPAANSRQKMIHAGNEHVQKVQDILGIEFLDEDERQASLNRTKEVFLSALDEYISS